jgi:hypothetical protein
MNAPSLLEAAPALKLNLVLAWSWILLGFLSGMVMGMFFHRENWLGGYGSHQRRLYRLAHISFFGLAIMNLLFLFTVQSAGLSAGTLGLASRAFALGTVTMPICCVILAHCRGAYLIFAVPVLSLIAGGTLTFWEVIHL